MFGRLKDWRRVATRYDRCLIIFLAAIALAAAVLFWLPVQSLKAEREFRQYLASESRTKHSQARFAIRLRRAADSLGLMRRKLRYTCSSAKPMPGRRPSHASHFNWGNRAHKCIKAAAPE